MESTTTLTPKSMISPGGLPPAAVELVPDMCVYKCKERNRGEGRIWGEGKIL